MQCTYLYPKFYTSTLPYHRFNPFLPLIFTTLFNSSKNETTQKHVHRFHSTISSKDNSRQPQMLGFIDDLRDGVAVRILHGRVIKDGSMSGLGVGNYMLSLYVKFKDLGNARKVFDEMLERDVRSWTVLVSGFARVGMYRNGFDLFGGMIAEGVCPNGFTLSSLFKCCSCGGLVSEGKLVHGWMTKKGIVFDTVLRNSVIDFYVKCDEIGYAKRLFELSGDVDTVSCNIMIGAFMQCGDMGSSLDMFKRLPVKDVASWNTVLSGMMRNVYDKTALELLYEMAKEKFRFDEFTYTIALSLASSLSMLELGVQLHGRLIRLELNDNEYIRPSLIDMYSKCGVIDKASAMFKQFYNDHSRKRHLECSRYDSKGGVVSWSSMISGYAQNDRCREALEMFCDMVREGINVDKYTLTTVVSVCADYGMLDFGQQVHGLVHKSEYKLDVFLCSSLVDMYSKCGSLSDAQKMFDQTGIRNTVLWTAIISGYALHGHGREAVRLFNLMTEDGIQPNEVTFVAVLTACSHAGLIDEGRNFFKLMKEVFDISPGVEHYTCMVDLFGRAGQLNEIKSFIHENNLSHLTSVWKAFLSSCRVHKHYDLGKWVSEKLQKLEPLDAEHYVLLSNMCGTSNRWEESAKVRSLMQKKGVRKQPGQSWIQLNNQVHTFVMGDRTHPQEAEIYSYLDSLIGRLKQIGYCIDRGQVTQDVEEEQQEMFLRSHSEKLAVVYGIISTTNRSPIRVMKNLRVCTDCHNFLKYTSQILGREIVVRDIRRFHYFKGGICSCGDYW
ncbi:hypothetical protein vseg_008496 [Gypsophila vaccaria]